MAALILFGAVVAAGALELGATLFMGRTRSTTARLHRLSTRRLPAL